MPLQPEKKRMGWVFDRLDDSIRGCRTGDQRTSDSFDRLVVRTVDLHVRALDDSVEQAAWGNGDAVRNMDGGSCLSMLQHIGYLGGYVLIEGPAAGDIHGLHAAADGESRNLVADSQTDQVQFKAGASPGDDRKRKSLPFSVQRGVQVRAASCQQQPVNACQEAPSRRTVGHERQDDRHAAELFNRADIAGPEEIRGLFAAPFLAIAGIEVGSDSDDGFHATGSVPMAAGGVLEECSPRLLERAHSRRHRGTGSAYRL